MLQPREAPQPGITCPHCGFPRLRVVRTRKRHGRIGRRRECRRCGRRVSTTECIVGK